MIDHRWPPHATRAIIRDVARIPAALSAICATLPDISSLASGEWRANGKQNCDEYRNMPTHIKTFMPQTESFSKSIGVLRM